LCGGSKTFVRGKIRAQWRVTPRIMEAGRRRLRCTGKGDDAPFVTHLVPYCARAPANRCRTARWAPPRAQLAGADFRARPGGMRRPPRPRHGRVSRVRVLTCDASRDIPCRSPGVLRRPRRAPAARRTTSARRARARHRRPQWRRTSDRLLGARASAR